MAEQLNLANSNRFDPRPLGARFLPNMTGQPPAASATGSYDTGSLAQKDRANIDFLLNPNFDQTETRMNAAEANLGSGLAGSGFAQGTTNRMLDSERIARLKLGHEILDPYLNREAAQKLQSQQEQARLNEIAAQGALALQQLQLQEAGLASRQSASERARLEQIAAEGNQAMQRLQLSEAGEAARQKVGIGGNIITTLLGRSDLGRSGSGGGIRPGFYSATFGGDDISRKPIESSRAPLIGGGGANLSFQINDILRRYGLGNIKF